MGPGTFFLRGAIKPVPTGSPSESTPLSVNCEENEAGDNVSAVWFCVIFIFVFCVVFFCMCLLRWHFFCIMYIMFRIGKTFGTWRCFLVVFNDCHFDSFWVLVFRVSSCDPLKGGHLFFF